MRAQPSHKARKGAARAASCLAFRPFKSGSSWSLGQVGGGFAIAFRSSCIEIGCGRETRKQIDEPRKAASMKPNAPKARASGLVGVVVLVFAIIVAVIVIAVLAMVGQIDLRQNEAGEPDIKSLELLDAFADDFTGR